MAHFIFMGAFYTVLTVVAVTLACALWRSRRALVAGQAEHIRWHSDFQELAPADRACRHVRRAAERQPCWLHPGRGSCPG